MVTDEKDFELLGDASKMTGYSRPPESRLTPVTRILGICTAVVVCGVGVDVAYHQHVMGFYVTNDDSLCWGCWSGVLAITGGWRRAIFYLPLSCILAWKPHRLWLSFVAAALLAVLSLLHILSSALSRRGSQLSGGADCVGESLLNTRPESYDRFEDVLKVTEVLDDGVPGSTNRMVESDGEM
ncbi:uncharacterized protein [Neodiprion pinetum]|uniref:Uncharacterized protein LOC107224656 isoform X6 n=1 Tax=Neodiprion lecontei TaxID=441921 RepID=A0ABM3FNU2_NEOLC|nr:uncharacterized protein LOC124177546 isoform X5 [Neodiprion fabricii]XP_046471609.1 uncharacterized protein LOC124213897 isoform X6 [Neodiprion pinetum]XP_046589686.1 uncharacterized protein LOC107224656 isoform X6 [Neodiprion lecontei]XP_046609957.1 uncharacterized protein LOC124300201 isoform X5 [Neodiprion virginianus]